MNFYLKNVFNENDLQCTSSTQSIWQSLYALHWLRGVMTRELDETSEADNITGADRGRLVPRRLLSMNPSWPRTSTLLVITDMLTASCVKLSWSVDPSIPEDNSPRVTGEATLVTCVAGTAYSGRKEPGDTSVWPWTGWPVSTEIIIALS